MNLFFHLVVVGLAIHLKTKASVDLIGERKRNMRFQDARLELLNAFFDHLGQVPGISAARCSKKSRVRKTEVQNGRSGLRIALEAFQMRLSCIQEPLDVAPQRLMEHGEGRGTGFRPGLNVAEPVNQRLGNENLLSCSRQLSSSAYAAS